MVYSEKDGCAFSRNQERSHISESEIYGASYNQEYDIPVLRSDLIFVVPNQWYKLTVTFEEGTCAESITPTITLPKKKGIIKLNGKTYQFMLSTCNDAQNPVSEMEILSESGEIDISYHCETVDYRNAVFWGSSKVMRFLGMKKEIISPTKVRYCCTNTQGNNFGCYIFTVEYQPKAENVSAF